MQGRLFVVSGPSGAGKSIICERLRDEKSFELSVSMTTRQPRTGEVPGVSYYYVSHEEFKRIIGEGGFFEYAEIYGNCYGTPKQPVLDKLAEGKDVILEIEMQGAAQVKNVYPQAILIFVIPPSLTELRQRLVGRGTETEEQLARRISKAMDEIRLIENYDYFVVNDDLDKAVETVKSIARGEAEPIGNRAKDIIRKYEEEL